jgi:hypothetical protein
MTAVFAFDAGRTKRSTFVRCKLELSFGWLLLARKLFGL